MKYHTNRRRSSLTVGELLLFLAGGMFCLILITTAMMGGLLARYTTEGEGTDSTRVAKFDVSAGLEDDVVNVVYAPKVDDSGMESQGVFVLKLTSDSEVAVRYDIVVTLEEALPNGITAELYDANNQKRIPTESDGSQVLTYENAGTFPAGDQQAEYELRFTVDWEKIDFAVKDSDDNPEEVTITRGFTVEVTMVQID